MKTESLTTEDIAALQAAGLPEPLADKLARAEGIQLYYKQEAPAEPSTFDPPEVTEEPEGDNTPSEEDEQTA